MCAAYLFGSPLSVVKQPAFSGIIFVVLPTTVNSPDHINHPHTSGSHQDFYIIPRPAPVPQAIAAFMYRIIYSFKLSSYSLAAVKEAVVPVVRAAAAQARPSLESARLSKFQPNVKQRNLLFQRDELSELASHPTPRCSPTGSSTACTASSSLPAVPSPSRSSRSSRAPPIRQGSSTTELTDWSRQGLITTTL